MHRSCFNQFVEIGSQTMDYYYYYYYFTAFIKLDSKSDVLKPYQLKHYWPCVCVGRVERKEENNRCCMDKCSARYMVKFVEKILPEEGVEDHVSIQQ